MKRVCQKRKRDVEEACGEAAGGGRGNGRQGGEVKLFSLPQHKPQAAAHHRGN